MARSESECLAIIKDQILDWRRSRYNYAANLLEYFIKKDRFGDYIPTSHDLEELHQHGKPKITAEIDAIVNEVVAYGSIRAGIRTTYKHGPGQVFVKIHHPGKGSTESSNTRWWYIVSNKNLLYAFGGADLNVEGTATLRVDGQYRIWSGSFIASVGDEYAFESKSWLKTEFSAFWSNAYEAALILERQYGYKSFYHKATISLNYNGITSRSSPYL